MTTNPATNTGATTNQSQYSDNQSYKIDIETFYNGFIKQIDAIRSNVSTSTNASNLADFIQSLNSTNPSTSTILSKMKVDPNNLQETRCHAFYRMLGLPSFEPGGSFYSPGLIHATVVTPNNNSINLDQTKINVAKNIPTDLYSLMDQREIINTKFLSIFSVSDINASVLALSSTKVRVFSVLPNTGTIDPFDSSVASQTHSYDDTQNSTLSADLLTYQDSNSNFPTGTVLGYLHSRPHIIKPFMVDPRVELTINPPYVGSPSTSDNTATCKIMGAPFPTDKSQHQYVENVYASSPMIETVCRARLSISEPTSNLSARWQDVLSYVKNANVDQDSDLLSQVFSNPTAAQEDLVFLKYINIMRSMMEVLFDALFHVISNTEGAGQTTAQNPAAKYHWVPIPNVKGPEFGSTTQGIIIGDPLNTNIDFAIANSIVTSEVAQINSQNVQNNQPDLGNFVNFENIPLTPDDQSTNSFGDRNQETLDDMTNKRTAQTDAANDALRKIEIIMGEFSGFGLCDIIATYLALWTIDQQALVNMLDSGAFNRLYQDPTLQSEAVQARQANSGNPTDSIIATMQAYEQQVIYIYAIMDKLWLDRTMNQGTTSFS